MADVARFPDGNAASRVELNWIGFQALYGREMRRFLVVWVQTVLGPVIATLLFFAVFAVVLRTRTPEIGHLSYLEFIAPGLIMMAMLQNAFANTSSSILISKLSGTMADLLSAPLGPIELTAGYALAAVARAWIVGGATALVLLPLEALSAEGPGRLLLFACGGPLVFALLGMAGGIWAEKMEHIAFMSNVIVAPATVLSGTFYSLQQLPVVLQPVALANPVFYLIDGFRGACTGDGEAIPWVATVVLVASNLLLIGTCLRLWATGWRLKP